MVNLQPRLGISWAVNEKTVVHLSGGTVDQGLNGLATDWLSFYYNSNTFNQVSSTRRAALDQRVRRRSRTAGVPGASGRRQSRLGAAAHQQQGLLVCELRRRRKLRPDRHDDRNTFDTPTNYMWGLSIQRQLTPNWAVTAEYLGSQGRSPAHERVELEPQQRSACSTTSFGDAL